jgi:hypothetical protein
MANFLSNLLNRFNSKAELVQTRPTSLFEPQTNLGILSWVENTPPADEIVAAEKQPAAGQSDAAAFGLSQQPVLSSRGRDPKTDFQPRQDEPQIKSGSVPTSGPLAQLGYLVVAPRALSDTSIWEHPAISRFESSNQGDQSSLELPRGANQEEGTPPQGDRDAFLSEKPPQKSGQNHVIRPKPRETVKSAKAVRINPRKTLASDSAPTEQVINVTIGRVEVQAVPATRPAKTKKQRGPSPIMSLDEYLKNRDQERPS